ncbi:MAG: ABC transporter ATP-binding protein [Deltaproteobacteria bacterium]|nr:ABC transporter ATP-binding protein [Deltaproteobacteria bacterium]
MTQILEIKNLKTSFDTKQGKIFASDDVSLSLPKGQITALVGESGSGKSVTAMSILRLIDKPGKIEAGQILLNNAEGAPTDLLTLSEKQMRSVRGNRIAMIFQEPMTSLNPVYTVGDQIMEAVMLHQKLDAKEARAKAIAMLKRVGIPNPERRIDNYPHEMSGGMRQRVMIAMGLSCHPELLIADEPTTALDVTIQAQILELIQGLVADTGMSVLLITHDLGIVAEYAQKVAVMYAGEIVEVADVKSLFANPKHPYTKGLLGSLPSLQSKKEKYLKAIPGVVPHLSELPCGCRFQDRCEKRTPDCIQGAIPLTEEAGRLFRCVHPC